jgi:hypothetical protein
VAGCCECGDEPSGSGAKELVTSCTPSSNSRSNSSKMLGEDFVP